MGKGREGGGQGSGRDQRGALGVSGADAFWVVLARVAVVCGKAHPVASALLVDVRNLPAAPRLSSHTSTMEPLFCAKQRVSLQPVE